MIKTLDKIVNKGQVASKLVVKCLFKYGEFLVRMAVFAALAANYTSIGKARHARYVDIEALRPRG